MTDVRRELTFRLARPVHVLSVAAGQGTVGIRGDTGKPIDRGRGSRETSRIPGRVPCLYAFWRTLPHVNRHRDQPTLIVRRLERRFGDRRVLNGVDLELAPGERVALTGPNGSGKTTMVRCVAGTLEPTSGSVRIGGHPAGSIDARRLIGVSLSQERSFYMRLSGQANLLFFARVRGHSRGSARRMVRELEDELELGSILRERADRCSTGMLQQLGFARALLGEPALLLLDEPTRSLDEGAVERLWSAIGRRVRTALLLATHRHEDLDLCGRRVDLSA
jgi:ABC-type multidrug transport system ATPase subunit